METLRSILTSAPALVVYFLTGVFAGLWLWVKGEDRDDRTLLLAGMTVGAGGLIALLGGIADVSHRAAWEGLLRPGQPDAGSWLSRLEQVLHDPLTMTSGGVAMVVGGLIMLASKRWPANGITMKAGMVVSAVAAAVAFLAVMVAVARMLTP